MEDDVTSKPLAVLHHEVDVQQGAGNCRERKEFVLLWDPIDVGHLGSVRNGSAIGGNTTASAVMTWYAACLMHDLDVAG